MKKIEKIAVLLISETALPIALQIREAYPSSVIYGKFEDTDVKEISSLTKTVQELFPVVDALVFIGALGICVRTIAPCLGNKWNDPAVICIDSMGKNIIPVISGHIGGSNDFGRELARLFGGEAIITTQSDNQGFWTLDTIGKTYDWSIIVYQNGVVKKSELTNCIATFVKQRPTALLLDIRDKGTDYLERTCPPHVTCFYKYDDIPFSDYELLITVSPVIYNAPIQTLSYFPKVLHLGMGCRKQMDGEGLQLYLHLTEVLRDNKLSVLSIRDLSSADIKKDERILNELADESLLNCDFITYPGKILDEVTVPNPSERVKAETQSGSVSEAAALLSSSGGSLLIEKQKLSLGEGQEFTLAVALDRSVMRIGHIEIVGAGPGDPELISVRGKQFLEHADLILYAGSLVPKELTSYARPGATVRSSADMNLETQLEWMKKFYDAGKLVVRLHTGDPCIYGAIQEQMALFDQLGMRYHITPGISSFQAAAAALRSQFTIPEKVQTIILTRGAGRTPMPDKEQLHKLAASRSTMCIYLSAGIAEQVQQELLVHYPPETPVAACYKLTWKDERIYRGELKNLARIVRENNLTLTTLLVVGDAIDNREGLSRLYADEFKHLFRS